MTYLNSLKRDGVEPILLDGGDWLFSLGNVKKNHFARRQLIDKGKLLVDAYNRFGYRAAAIAEHDLAFGIDTLRMLEERANFPFLCANLVQEGNQPVFPGSTIIESGGKKLGVIAVVAKLSDRFLATIRSHAFGDRPQRSADSGVDQAGRVRRCRVRPRPSRSPLSSKSGAEEIEGIDFILDPSSYGGNESTWINPSEEFANMNGRLLLRVSGQGSTIGRLDLYLRKRGAPWIDVYDDASSPENIYSFSTTRLAAHIGKHPGIQALVDKFLKGTRYQGVTESDLVFEPSPDYLGAETCSACHVEQSEFWRGTGHGKAYSTLEKSGDQFRYDCVSCHVLGYGETFVDAHAVGQFKDVQCESCHGTNPQHPLNPPAHPWGKVNVERCWPCHAPRVTRVSFEPASAFPKVSCPPLKRN